MKIDIKKLGFTLLSIIFLTFFIFHYFSIIDYDKAINPDVVNYIANYEKSNWSYEVGFEFFQSIFRDVLNFKFDEFWLLTLILICVLFFLIGFNAEQIPFFVINYFFLAQTMGTQVRYFIGALLFIFCAQNVKNKYCSLLFLFLCCLFHYGLGIIYFLYFISGILSKKYPASMFYDKRNSIFLMIIASFFIVSPLLSIILPYTRFYYYSGSSYMEAKSISSFIYTVIILFYLILAATKLELNNAKDRKFVFFSIIMLLFVCSASSVAVLSGRVLLIYVVFEVVIAKILFNAGKDKIQYYFLFLFLSSVKILPDLMKLLG